MRVFRRKGQGDHHVLFLVAVFAAVALGAVVINTAHAEAARIVDAGRAADALPADGGAALADASIGSAAAEELRRKAHEIRALVSGGLAPEVAPESLFDVSIADEQSVRLEAARLTTLLRQIGETQRAASKVSETSRRARLKAAGPDGGSSYDALASVDPDLWAARVDLDRARFDFYALSTDQRRAILDRHAEREAAAARALAERPLSEAEQRARDDEVQRQKALEEARLAHSEAERLVAEEYSRLLGVSQAQSAYEATLGKLRQELSEQREITLGWQRRAREAREGRGGTAGDVDATYDDLRKELRNARSQLAEGLDEATSGTSSVPPAGPDPLAALQIEVEATKARGERKQVETEARRLRAEEQRLREERAAQLLEEIDKLNQERLSLLDFLSPSKRDAITGFASAGIGQAASEARQLSLVLRYHRHATANWFTSLRQPGRSYGGMVAPALWVVFQWLLVLGLFTIWRRRAAVLLRTLRARVNQRDRQAHLGESSLLDKGLGFLEQVRRPLEWLVLLVVLRWLLPEAAKDLLEVQLVSVILSWAFTGSFVVNALNAIASANRRGEARSSTVDASSLRLRSLRLVGRVVVAFGLILVITSRLVGQGTLYQWVWSTCWIASIPVFLVLMSWWRETVFRRTEMVRKKTPFEKWLLENRTGWKSFPAATAGSVHLFAVGSWRAIRGWVGRFEATRRFLAYLFRRELDKLGEERAELELNPLPPEAYEKLGPESPSPHWISADLEKRAGTIAARLQQASGGVFAIVGERGMGKSRLLARIKELAGDVLLLDLSSQTSPDLRRLLNETVAFPSETTLLGAAEQLNRLEKGSGLLLDGADRFVQPVMGGLALFDEVISAARRNSTKFVWVLALDHVVWQFLERARGARPLFDDVIRLERWGEEDIVELLCSRTKQSGLDPSFELLLDRLPANADDIDKQDALRRRAASYYRLVWDYASGNPGVALHIWRSSLGIDEAGTCYVRLFQTLDTYDLEMLPDPAVFVLRAVLQLAPASPKDIARATMLRAVEIADALRYAVARGYVEEQAGNYVVTWTWFRAMTRFLQRRHLLVAQ